MQTEEFFYSEEGIKERELKLKVFKNLGIKTNNTSLIYLS